MAVPATLPDNLPALADSAIRAIRSARSLDEVKGIRDLFKIHQHVAKCLNAAIEAKNACAKVVIIATQREGEALAGMEKAKGAAATGGPGRGKKNPVARSDRVFAEPITLKELGITKSEASRAQRIASIPDDDLQSHFAEVERSGGEITTAGVLRLAAKQEAKKPKAAKRAKRNGSAHNPIDLCAMEVRRIVLAAIREMSGDDAATLIAELRDELDDIEKVAERKVSAHHAQG